MMHKELEEIREKVVKSQIDALVECIKTVIHYDKLPSQYFITVAYKTPISMVWMLDNMELRKMIR